MKLLIVDADSFFIGALASFLSSIVVILLLFIFAKPKFKLSREICKIVTNQYGEELNGSYLIKVFNQSFFDAFDLRANLEVLEDYLIDNGTNNRAIDLELVDKTTKHLSGRHLFKNTGRSCFLFRSTSDLRSEISGKGKKLRFTLMARNGFSGLTKVFVQEFNVTGKIKDGHFGFGKDFEIK